MSQINPKFNLYDIPQEVDFDGNRKDVFVDDNRLKIFVQPANTGGCAYYRCWLPFKKLQEANPDKVQIIYDLNPLRANRVKGGFEEASPNFETCDIFFTHNICNFGGEYTLRSLLHARSFGKLTHYDTDDLLTELYEGHRLKKLYKEKKLDVITKQCYEVAHLTSVTQVKFAERIAPFVGGMLVVIKNAIDFEVPCWNAPKIQMKNKKLVRIGWVGGIHHEEDVKEFAAVALRVNAKVGKENVHWGFYGKPQPGEEKDNWQLDVWDNYEKYLSAGISNYSIYPAMPSYDYGRMYTNIDISIAPLQMNAFNDSKSEIKVIEAGIYKIPLIASDVGCYDEHIVNGKNGYLIPNDVGPQGFVKPLVDLIKHKKKRLELGKNLHELVSAKFNINNFPGARYELYLSLQAKVKEFQESQESQDLDTDGETNNE